MSHWLRKSNGNLQAASAMYANQTFCHSSIHCGYYACLQLIKHVLYNVVEPRVELSKEKSVHTEARKQMFYALGRVDQNLAISFNDNYVNLYDFRTESDYENVEIAVPKAEQAYKIAVRICQDIKNNFHE